MLAATQLARGSRRAQHDESRADIEPLELALLLGEQEAALECAAKFEFDLLEIELDVLASKVRGHLPASDYADGWI